MDEFQTMVAQRAKELYDTCDVEQKGYITRTEMSRLISLLPLSLEQLESVFDSLDDDGNGQLTLQEFSDGFGQFIIGDQQPEPEVAKRNSVYFGDQSSLDSPDKTNGNFEMLSDTALFEESVSEFWQRMQQLNPNILPGFETLLKKLTVEIQKQQTAVKKMENAISQKSSEHDKKIHELYSEMEGQIKAEERRLIQEEALKEKQMRKELQKELNEKDRHYKELEAKHQINKRKLEELNNQHAETEQEIKRLAEEKAELEELYEETEENLEESKCTLEELQKGIKEDRRFRAAAAANVSQGISSEKDDLVQQLNQLRELNKKLRDDRDEGVTQSNDTSRSPSPLFGVKNIETESSSTETDTEDDTQSESEPHFHIPTEPIIIQSKEANLAPISGVSFESVHSFNADIEEDECEIDEMPVEVLNQPLCTGPLYQQAPFNAEERTEGVGQHSIPCEHVNPMTVEAEIQTDNMSSTVTTPTEEKSPVFTTGIQSTQIKYKELQVVDTLPDCVFKVVIVGDSGVGKTAIVDRFVNNSFRENYCQTVGIDFQIKSIIAEGRRIALQMWDTAGQERFQCITKQFYRKADGIVLVYDISSQTSFENLQKWAENIRDTSVDENYTLMVLGNKMDLKNVNDANGSTIPCEKAKHISKEFGAIFSEVSAKENEGISEAFELFASNLKLREEEYMKNSINLEAKAKGSSGCCCKRN